MTEECFNLIDSQWIPVRNLDGGNRLVSLETLFREASRIADVTCLPHERVSLMRLLVCIAQAALGAPESPDDWGDFGHDRETRITDYLRHKDVYPHFHLFGDGPRFLQVLFESQKDPVPASKLFFHLATGNNPTLLDHEGGDSNRRFSPQSLALALLSFQCFYPLYGAGYKGKGPCVDGNMLHTLVCGKNLKETILSNCLTKDVICNHFQGGLGKPIWQLKLPDEVRVATLSYLGRLIPRHRNLWLIENGTGFFIEQAGIEYPTYPQAREPSATVVVIQKKSTEERTLLASKLDKAVWRDLHCLTVIRQSNLSEIMAPVTLYIQSCLGRDDIPIWTGGVVTDFKAKIFDIMESSFTVPQSLFTDIGRKRYESGISYADQQSHQLYGAVKQYGSEMKNESPPTNLAKQHYWNALEQQSTILLEIACQPEPLAENFGEGNDSWTVAVQQAARAAYDHVCPRQTPRQIQAYAAGLKILLAKSNSKKTSTRRSSASV